MELIRIFYPKVCPVCESILPDVPGENKDGVCIRCNSRLHYIKSPKCLKCGKQIYEMNQEFCCDCKNKKHEFVQGAGVFAYDEEIKKSIYRFKYSNQREYSHFYARAIVNRLGYQIRHWMPDIIIPIPLNRIKYLKRGYNQAELVARSVGDLLDIPVDSKLLIRTRNTRPMKELNDEERVKNLQNAFKIRSDIVKYNKVLLLDDIYTTGATIDACSALLKEAGAKEIFFVSVCIGNGF